MTLVRIKKQATEWEEIFEDHLPDQGLISRIYKNSTVKKTRIQLENGQ